MSGCPVHGTVNSMPVETHNRGSLTLITYACLAKPEGQQRHCSNRWVEEIARVA